MPQEAWLTKEHFYKHIGLYAFSRSFLLETYPNLVAGHLEKIEKLEQLSWLEQNLTIRILKTTYETPNIDTPEDLEKALKWLEEQCK